MMRGSLPSRHRPPYPARRPFRSPAFARKLRQMAIPLVPLVQYTSGQVHPAFPGTVLAFWLLTDAQLEALARFYHQQRPGPWSACYPCPVVWDSRLPLEEKRRRMAQFIGLRVCEAAPPPPPPSLLLDPDEDLVADAQRARMAEDDEMWRRKLQP